VTARLFAPRALVELVEATVWIAKDQPAAGERLLEAAIRSAEMLQTRPMLGRVRPGLAPERYRFWSLRGFPYVMIYVLDGDGVIILRVVHTARDLHVILAELED
jgi:toxin ParE1/3/4